MVVTSSEKGSSSSLIVERVIKIVSAIGSSTIVIKSDQEFAIKDVQNEVRKRIWKEKNALISEIKRASQSSSSSSTSATPQSSSMVHGMNVILENSPVGESQSNGSAEQAVRVVQGQIRQ